MAKAVGHPIAKYASLLMAGKTLKEIGLTEEPLPKNHVAVKEVSVEGEEHGGRREHGGNAWAINWCALPGAAGCREPSCMLYPLPATVLSSPPCSSPSPSLTPHTLL